MYRLVITCSAVLLVIFALGSFASPQDDGNIERGSKNKPSQQLWFGPRLGRRKRNPTDGGAYRTPSLEPEQLEALMDLIQESPWAIVAVNEGKRHAVNFTPRLGRESGEELISADVPNIGTERWFQNPEMTGELMSQRSPPFAPRLGKRVLPFSPRLGRENDRT